MCNKIKYALEHPHEMEEMGERAYQWVTKHRNWQKITQAYLKLYREIIADGDSEDFPSGESGLGGMAGVAQVLYDHGPFGQAPDFLDFVLRGWLLASELHKLQVHQLTGQH